jgi:hypothetical protein
MKNHSLSAHALWDSSRCHQGLRSTDVLDGFLTRWAVSKASHSGYYALFVSVNAFVTNNLHVLHRQALLWSTSVCDLIHTRKYPRPAYEEVVDPVDDGAPAANGGTFMSLTRGLV